MRRHLPTATRQGKARKKRRVSERGVALILVLGAITVLTVFLTQLQEDTSSELASALAERDALKAEYHARSAINLSRLVLAAEPEMAKQIKPIFTMLGVKMEQLPVWDFLDILLGPFNDATGTQSFLGTIGGDAMSAKNLGLSGGRFEVTMVDETSKINVNTAAVYDPARRDRLAEALLGLFAPVTNNPLFELRDPDNQYNDRQTVCGAIVDWVDSDPSGNETQFPCDPRNPNASASGPEDNFYQTIGLPYRRKNAAFDSLEELRLVRGLSNDDFWATFVDPDPEDPKKRLLTVWGTNKTNVASANAQTLLALACGNAPEAELCTDPTQSSSFLMALTLAKSFVPIPLLGNGDEFIQAMQGKGMLGQLLTQFGVKPVTFKRPAEVKKFLSGRSTILSIYAVGIVPGYKRTTKVKIHAVIDRRTAGALTAATTGTGSTGATALAATAQAAGAQSGLGGGTTSLTTPSAAGTVIYWRVE